MTKQVFRDSEVVTIKDALGLEWDIKEARETKYGFEIYYGKRKNAVQYEAGGPNRLIYTKELQAFFEKYSFRKDGTLFDLPVGRTTLKRARIALGFHWFKDAEKFWRKRKRDLTILSSKEFTRKHEHQKIGGKRLSAWRRRILGSQVRPRGWWRTTEVVKLLLSDEISLNQVRAQLTEKISTSQAHRMRREAKRDYEMRDGEVIRRDSPVAA